jgi:hypothetical protein
METKRLVLRRIPRRARGRKSGRFDHRRAISLSLQMPNRGVRSRSRGGWLIHRALRPRMSPEELPECRCAGRRRFIFRRRSWGSLPISATVSDEAGERLHAKLQAAASVTLTRRSSQRIGTTTCDRSIASARCGGPLASFASFSPWLRSRSQPRPRRAPFAAMSSSTLPPACPAVSTGVPPTMTRTVVPS